VAVREVVVLEEVANFFRSSAESKWHIGGSNTFGSGENVRSYAPQIHGEPFAGASPSAHDFIGNEQHTMVVADAAQLRHIFRRRRNYPVRADNRFDDHCGHIGFVADHMLDVISAGDPATWIGVPDGALIAMHFRPEDDTGAFAARFHGPAARITGGSDGAGSRSVIRAVASDDLCLAGIHARNLEGGFIGVRA